jgi:hypothetical protein
MGCGKAENEESDHMHSRQLLCSAISFFLIAPSLLASDRVALVVDRAVGADRAVALAEARLSTSTTGIAMVERNEIDHVLGEQRQSLSGLADASKAIVAGRLLNADLFAVVEGQADFGATGLVVFDASSGAILQDGSLTGTLGDAAVAAQIAQSIEAAIAKRRLGLSGLHTVGVLSVRNVDLPRSMDGVCGAVGLLLERSLVDDPEIVVLDRRRLGQVVRERSLPTTAPAANLSLSAITIDLEISRGGKEPTVRAQATLTRADGRPLGKADASAASGDAAGLAASLSERIRRLLDVKPVVSAPDPIGRAAEARQFLTEARFLDKHDDSAAALAAAESARAVDPESAPAMAELACAYAAMGKSLILVSYKLPSARQASADIGPAFEFAQRALDLLTENFDHADVRLGRESEWDHVGQLLADLCERAASERHLAAGADSTVGNFRSVYRTFLMRALMKWADDGRNDTYALEIFAAEFSARYRAALECAAPTMEQRSIDLCAVVSRWLDAWKAAGDAFQLRQGAGALNDALRFFVPDGYMIDAPQFGPADFNRLDAVLESMSSHPVPLVRLYGIWGRLWIADQTGHLKGDALAASFGSFAQIAEDDITRATGAGSLRRRVTDYKAAVDAIRYIPLPHAADFAARMQLAEFMLGRHDLADEVIRLAIDRAPADSGEARRQLDLSARIAAALSDPATQFVDGGRRERFAGDTNGLLQDQRARIEAKFPELAAPRVAPWSDARSLIRRKDFAGIDALTEPIVYNNVVYVVGIHLDPNKRTLELIAASLPDGKPKTLGSATLEGHTRWPANQFATGISVGDGWMCVGTKDAGAAAIPITGGDGFQLDEAHGLPSNHVTGVASFGGAIYIAMADGGYLARREIKSGAISILASSRRKQHASPFDDTLGFEMPTVLADPAGNGLLCLVGITPSDQEHQSRSGLWHFDPETGSFRQIQVVRGVYFMTRCRSSGDNRVSVESFGWQFAVDLKTSQATMVYATSNNPAIPGLDALTAPYQNLTGAFPPYVEFGGWLWSPNISLQRISPGNKAAQRLPALNGSPGDASYKSVVVANSRQLLISDDDTVWIATFADTDKTPSR